MADKRRSSSNEKGNRRIRETYKCDSWVKTIPSPAQFKDFRRLPANPPPMIFTRVLPLFALALSFTLGAVAKPVADAGLIKRADADTADIAAVFNTLKSSTDSILPQIENLVDSGNANSGNIVPLITQLTTSFSTADASLTELKGKPGSGKPGPSKDELAKIIALILIAVIKTLTKVIFKVGLFIPTLSILLIALDIAINKLLLSVDIVAVGLLKLIAGLLFEVAGLLGSIGFTLVFALLKLHGGW
ncbi:hypothetical protein PC9H_002203 [Pleurotus ostreatus]|uniref:Uncharacterized protein n=2 Tax=Pleurotus ostreatus TaxID=5322 RepID=A0A8H6ZL69_PLEOS|nr:uncharacterized protein PC9H_002203 [Pleurotus ostreatus]KAF7419612.1 hypothetical protein PC9H_002203 [Pleurotus ostreatus]